MNRILSRMAAGTSISIWQYAFANELANILPTASFNISPNEEQDTKQYDECNTVVVTGLRTRSRTDLEISAICVHARSRSTCSKFFRIHQRKYDKKRLQDDICVENGRSFSYFIVIIYIIRFFTINENCDQLILVNTKIILCYDNPNILIIITKWKSEMHGQLQDKLTQIRKSGNKRSSLLSSFPREIGKMIGKFST